MVLYTIQKELDLSIAKEKIAHNIERKREKF